MWTLTPDYLATIKEVAKGRRAAIQARVADELKAIEAELEEIEALERAAYAFAVKHLPELEGAQAAAPPPVPEEDPEQVAALQPEPANPSRQDREPVAKERSLSRWRMSMASKAETEKASIPSD